MEKENTFFAVDLANDLLTCSSPSVLSIAESIMEKRQDLLLSLKDSDSESEKAYWLSHKVVLSIDTDWDFYFRNEDGEMTNNDTLEWSGASREEVIKKARAYLTNKSNYSGNEKNIEYFISDFMVTGLDHISQPSSKSWNSLGNWEVALEYFEPDPKEAERRTSCPCLDILGFKVLLLTKEECDEYEYSYPE